MHVEYLIIGQGICGTFLSWYLEKEGKSFLVIDKDEAVTPSKVAAGIINPVTGRRLVTVWLAEEVLPFAAHAWHEMGEGLGVNAISQKNLIDFFPNVHQRQVFLERIEEGGPYFRSYPEQNNFISYFNYELGCGEIRNCYTVHLENILPAWKKKLHTDNKFRHENFEMQELVLTGEKVQYKNIIADKIIFCDGLNSFQTPYFKQLPFAPNKGEALILEIPDLPDHHIYKRGFMLAPMSNGLFWLGSNYQWEFHDADPSKEFYAQAEAQLKFWLKIPFRIVDHKASLRPATLERRPFAGLHPHQKNIGILNGMGTKGASLGPYFAHQLVQYLVKNEPVDPLADINRFQRILSMR